MPTQHEIRSGVPDDLTRDPRQPRSDMEQLRALAAEGVLEAFPELEIIPESDRLVIEGGCGHQLFGRYVAEKIRSGYIGFDIDAEQLAAQTPDIVTGDVLEPWDAIARTGPQAAAAPFEQGRKATISLLPYVANWLTPQQLSTALARMVEAAYFSILCFAPIDSDSKYAHVVKKSEETEWGCIADFKIHLWGYEDKATGKLGTDIVIRDMHMYRTEWIKQQLIAAGASIRSEFRHNGQCCIYTDNKSLRK